MLLISDCSATLIPHWLQTCVHKVKCVCDLRPYSWLISISLFWWMLRANIFYHMTYFKTKTGKALVYYKRRISIVGQSDTMKVIQGTNLAKKLIPPQTTKPGYPRHLLWAAHPPNGSKQKCISHQCYMWGKKLERHNHILFYCPALNSWRSICVSCSKVPKIIPADAASDERCASTKKNGSLLRSISEAVTVSLRCGLFRLRV